MEPAFWHARWEAGQTGFHLNEVHPLLSEHWSSLGLAEAGTVFVPLCGKTRDLGWLAGQGHNVVGVELSPIAAAEFFADAGITPQVDAESGFQIFSGAGIRIYCGDFFELTRAQLGPVNAVYDRAALIALPAADRRRYATRLARLAGDAPILLVTLDYAQRSMNGPPFAVADDEVFELFEGDYRVERLASKDVLDSEPKFAERGLTWLREQVFRLTPL